MDKMDNTPKARKYGGLSTMDNDPKEKITGDGMDKSYFARCQKILREWGAPLSGWHCQGVYDVREDDSCICAGVMEGDILAARERERLMRNRSKRKRSFPERKWEQTTHGWRLTYHGKQILIGRSRRNPKHLGVKCRGQIVWTYKEKPITNFLSAAYAAFNQ